MKSLLLKIVDWLNPYSLFHRSTTNRAAVFMLHEILPEGRGSDRSFSADQLESFLAYLRDNKYNVISLREYVDLVAAKRSSRKTVVFTVDDGFADFYQNAFPVFRKYNYPATIFLTSDFIDGRLFFWWNQIEFGLETTKKNSVDLAFIEQGTAAIETPAQRAEVIRTVTEALKFLPNETKLSVIGGLLEQLEVDIVGQPRGKYQPLDWSQIREMHTNRIEFYPHTKTHPILTRIGRDEKKVELAESKRRLEEELERRMDIFCYPNGGPNDIDDETIEVLKECGYRAAVTGMPGFDDSTGKTDMFMLRRYSIPNSLPVFKQIVSGLEAFKEGLCR
jgi:peptidoglycan/xylan/chitin deacetylase (PgdA/CDA1 family)